jgi:20S proteasome alpha/beta subunit
MMRRFMKIGGKTFDCGGRSGYDGISLERWRKIRHRIRKTKPKVTIAIGLISSSKDRPHHMIFASDSQTTYGAAKSLDAQKISIVDFADGQVLIAQSGMAELADSAIDIMRKKAKALPIKNAETVENTAVESVREIRNHFYELNRGCISSEDGWKRFFLEDNFFQLLVGYYFERKPHLFSADIDMCLAIPVRHPYKAIGIGRDYAETVLREYLQADPDFEYAQIIATTIVEKTIDNVDGCGRPTWVGIVCPQDPGVEYELQEQVKSWQQMNLPPDKKLFKSVAFLVGKDATKWVADELKIQEEKFGEKRKEMIIAILEAAQAKRNEWAKKIMAESQAASSNPKQN